MDNVINLCDMVNQHIMRKAEPYDPEYFIREVSKWQKRPAYQAYFAKKYAMERKRREEAKRKAERKMFFRRACAVFGGVILTAGTALLVVFGIN